MTKNVTLRQLRALVAIDSEGKIVAAARLLGLTAPAVTLQLRQLEDDVGVDLFERTAHGMRPTVAGEAFIDAARAILGRLDLLDEELDAIRGVRKGGLRVGVVSTAGYFAPQLTAAFTGEYPDVAVELMVGKRPETMLRLKNYEVDIVLTARPPRDVSVRAMAFAEYRLVIVASPRHPLVGRDAVHRSEIAREHFIVREPGSGPRASVERFLAEGPGKPDFHYTEMTSNELIRQAVTDELGVAFVAAHTVADDIRDGRLAVLDVAGLPIRRQWFAVTRSDRALTPVIARFQDFLAAHGARYLQPNEAAYAHE